MAPFAQRFRRRAAFVAAFCAAAAGGCGPTGPKLPTCYPVSGKVLIDGKPAVRAAVGLHPKFPQDDGNKYAGQTFTGDDGSFRMTTFTAGDGVPSGEYVVTIKAEWVSKDGRDVAVPDLLGGRYSTPATSPLKIQVQEVPLELETFDLKSEL